MDEKSQAPSAPQEVPLATRRRTDVDAFLQLLPDVVGSFASKNNDAKTITDLSIHLAREMTGQIVSSGMADSTMVCRDGQPLGLDSGAPIRGQTAGPLGQGPIGNGSNRQGAMVAHFDNQSVQKIQGL